MQNLKHASPQTEKCLVTAATCPPHAGAASPESSNPSQKTLQEGVSVAAAPETQADEIYIFRVMISEGLQG